jgi:hypothetical protein
MNKLLLITIIVCIFSILEKTLSFPLTFEECDQDWFECFEIFEEFYGRNYQSTKEREFRFHTFLDSLDRMHHLNSNAEGLASFGVNEFSDMTVDEFRKTKLTILPNHFESDHIIIPTFENVIIPTSFDWRNSSPPVITQVNNQLECGACWAESATETVESYWALAGNPLVQLSVQQSVDCCSQAYGCMGGWPSWAYDSLISEGGLESAADYPYEGVNERCRFNNSEVVATITSWATLTTDKNETLMAAWISQNGPLSVCVDASTWMDYTNGIIWHDCGNWINHCVQIVGYSVSERGIPYWTVRNSWGTEWGEDGYLQVYRGNNTCAIAQVVTTVTI